LAHPVDMLLCICVALGIFTTSECGEILHSVASVHLIFGF